MDVVMPKMGESVSEGTIIKWHKKKGDKVNVDEIIFEISTDKVDTEIPSPAEGTLTEIKAEEGDTVEVGTVVAVIDTNGDGTAASSKEDSTSSKDNETKIQQPKTEKEQVTQEKAEKINTSAETSKTASVSQSKDSPKGEIIEIQMPKMGESVMEGTIIKWYKKVGEDVKKDETIFEISTDKVDTEVPSPAEGKLSEILVAEQETVEVGTIVAKLSTGENAAVKVASKENEKVVQTEEKVETNTPEKEEEISTPSEKHDNYYEDNNNEEGQNKETSQFLSPLVLNIAQKEKVSFDEINSINGTGLNGRVTKKDILQYIEDKKNTSASISKETPTKEQAQTSQPTATSAPQMAPIYSSDDVEKIPMDNIRQKIMQHMINSRDTSVHVAAMLEVDMSKIYNFIQKNKESYLQNEGVKLTYMPFIASACVKALKEFPLINSMIEGSTIIRKKYINLGIAVAIEPTGLIVPNIKSADQRNLIGIAKSINDLATRARTRKLTPDDITNGTFTITNYGVFGTIIGTPIINQPEVAILGVGTVTKKPVVVEVDGTDTIAIKPIMALTLSHDHRLVDGMLGGRFLKYMKDSLESFNEDSI